MHALHKLHDALAPGGLLVDAQPVSPRPRVSGGGAELGALDMRTWLTTIAVVDGRIDVTVAAGRFQLLHEARFVVEGVFDDGPECLDALGGWDGTRVGDALAARIRAAPPPLAVAQAVRLRLLRRTP